MCAGPRRGSALALVVQDGADPRSVVVELARFRIASYGGIRYPGSGSDGADHPLPAAERVGPRYSGTCDSEIFRRRSLSLPENCEERGS
jgi:hypothetical protein